MKDYWKKKVKGSGNAQKYRSLSSSIQKDRIAGNGNQKPAGALQSSLSDNSIRTLQSE